jgi:hypothetical protein
MRFLMLDFRILRLVSLLIDCSCIASPSYSGCDSNEGVSFPSSIL